MGVGTVHHVAWRTPTDKQQTIVRREILKQGYNANPPGFAIDEEIEELGNHLMLPPWLEPDRKSLGKILPKINLPSSQNTAKVTTREENEIK
jgi:glyoxalase family protein